MNHFKIYINKTKQHMATRTFTYSFGWHFEYTPLKLAAATFKPQQLPLRCHAIKRCDLQIDNLIL